MTVASSLGDNEQPHQASFWISVICGAAILTIGIGARSSFGIFQKPIAEDLQVGCEVWSFANALAVLLMGLLSPFVGNLADRFGTARTVACGGASRVQEEISSIQNTYGQDHLQLTVVKGHLARLVGNEQIARYLSQRHPEILGEFRNIAEMTSTLPSEAA